MKHIRILSALLCAAMLCGLLSGCFGKSEEPSSSASAPASGSVAAPSTTVPESTSRADTSELNPNNFDENSIFTITGTQEAFAPCLGWGPGVSGCSLKSVIAAASLLDWAETNRLSARTADAIQSAYGEWYASLGSMDQANFAESWPMIREAALELFSDKAGMTGRIEDAGLDADKLPGCTLKNWQALQSVLDDCVPEAASEE